MQGRFHFEEPLLEGTLVRRYKRFLADIELDDGRDVTAHCANSGSMLGMQEPGSPVYVRHVPDPKRKLKWTWELVSPDGGTTWVGCNTQRPNQVVGWALAQGLVPGFEAGLPARREVRVGESRLDLVVERAGGPCFIEVKNTTLAREGVAQFPDAVTSRGAKHMRELAHIAKSGGDAAVLFFVNRGDCDRFSVADDIDPVYAEALAEAADAGVRVLPLGMHTSPEGWRVRGELPVQ